MAAFSDYFANNIINHCIRNQAFTPPTTLYVALFTSTATTAELQAGVLTNEVVGGSYARQTITFAAASAGSTSNSGSVTWTNMPACTVTYAAIMDTLSSGHVLVFGALLTPRTILAGDTLALQASDIVVSFG